MMDFAVLAAQCAPDIHPTTLAAVVSHESAVNPYAIGINSKQTRLTRQPRNLAEAVATAEDLMRRGVDFDAGLGQINVRNWRWLNLDAQRVFDPCTNLHAAQRVLADCYIRAAKRYTPGQPALIAALSCYNTGHFERGQRNGYVQRVFAQAGLAVPAIAAHTKDPAPSRPPTAQTRQPDAFSETVHDAFTATPSVQPEETDPDLPAPTLNEERP